MCKGPVMRTAECSWHLESEKEDAGGKKDQTGEDPVGLRVWSGELLKDFSRWPSNWWFEKISRLPPEEGIEEEGKSGSREFRREPQLCSETVGTWSSK